jgi:hypothetical protein
VHKKKDVHRTPDDPDRRGISLPFAEQPLTIFSFVIQALLIALINILHVSQLLCSNQLTIIDYDIGLLTL